MALKLEEIPFNQGSGSSLMTVLSTLLLFLATMFYASYDALKVNRVFSTAAQCPGYIVIVPDSIGTGIQNYDEVIQNLFSRIPDVFSYQLISPQNKTYFSELGVPNASGNYIDVKILPDSTLSKNTLSTEIEAILPGAQVLDRVSFFYQKRLERSVLGMSVLGLAFVMIFSVMVAAAFIARSHYRLHTKIIDILHYLGASNRYVIQKFQKHFFQRVLKGGLFGTLSAFCVLLLVGLTVIEPTILKSWIMQQFMNICIIMALAIGAVVLTVKVIVFLLIRHSH
jgi:cell division protein FtsX